VLAIKVVAFVDRDIVSFGSLNPEPDTKREVKLSEIERGYV
jgi:hypothetical protein